MSVHSVMKLIENKADILQNYFVKPSQMNTAFFAGAVSVAFGMAADIPVLREAGLMAVGVPTVVCGLCQISKFSARAVKRYAPEP